MLLSQTFHEIPQTRDNLKHSAKERRESSGSTQPNFPKTSMSVSSLSSSSSPSNASTPPDLKQDCALEPCENGSFVKTDSSTFPLELFEKAEAGEARSPRSDSCSGGYFGNVPQHSVKNSNGAFNPFSNGDTYNKYYEQSAAFDGPLQSSLSHASQAYHQTNSQDPSTGDQSHLTPQSGSGSGRKSYDNITDKELRKKLKNRESAQAARDRKKAKMLSLERQVSELHERYRLVENENQELRIRIQRMEASAYWRMEKQETNGISQDTSGIIPFPFTAIGPPTHVTPSSEAAVYSRTGQYPGLCGFGDYGQQPTQCIAGGEAAEEGSLPGFSQMTLDAADFHSSSYPQNIWAGENLGPQHPANFSVGDPGNYSDNGNILG